MSEVVHFEHKLGREQSYVYGEKIMEKDGRKYTVNKQIRFQEYQFETADPEQISFLRKHSEYKRQLFEITPVDQEEVQAAQEAIQAVRKKKSSNQGGKA